MDTCKLLNFQIIDSELNVQQIAQNVQVKLFPGLLIRGPVLRVAD